MTNVAVVCQISEPVRCAFSSAEELVGVLRSKHPHMYVTTTRMYACLLEDVTQQMRLAIEMAPLRVLEKHYKVQIQT